MEIKQVKQSILFNKIQIFLLEALLKEDEEDISNNRKLAKHIKKYAASFRDLWLEYED